MKNHLEALVKLAQAFDDQGKVSLAQQMDTLILKIAEEMEEEGEPIAKGPRSVSNKAKKKISAVCRACESLCSADLDFRGEHKAKLYKFETLCKELCELAAEFPFLKEGEE